MRSDEVAAKISELRQEGFTLTEISEAPQLSIGVVHKASKEGAWLRPETAERILELEVPPESSWRLPLPGLEMQLDRAAGLRVSAVEAELSRSRLVSGPPP